MSESCNSRHFSWLMKSCISNPHHPHNHLHSHCLISSTVTTVTPTSIFSLPDDLVLECLSRVPSSSLSSISLVCRRWSHLLDSPIFYNLRHRLGHLRLTLFAVSITHSSLYIATHQFGHETSWKIASFLSNDVVSPKCSLPSFSHARLASIGPVIFIIARTATFRFDTWTRTMTQKPAMLVPRKKFAAAVVAGKIYIAGGTVRSANVEEYDPFTDTWRVVANAARKRFGCIGASVDGVFYIIGGLKIGSPENGEASRSCARAVSGVDAHVYASSMDLYDVAGRGWLRSRAVPGGGCVVAACAADGHVYMLTSHAVELSFWKFNGLRQYSGGSGGGYSGVGENGFGEWCRLKSPPLPAQGILDSKVRFSCVGVGDKVVLIQVTGYIDELLRSGWRVRGLREGLVLVYDSAAGEWCRGVDLPEVIRRATCVCVEC